MEIIVVSTLLMLAVSAIITLFICLHYYFKNRKHLKKEVEALQKTRKNWDDIIERFDNGKQTAEDIIESKKYVWLTNGYSNRITKRLLKEELKTFDYEPPIVDPYMDSILMTYYRESRDEAFFNHITINGKTNMSDEDRELLKNEIKQINDGWKILLRKKQKMFTYLMKERFRETFGSVVLACFYITLLLLVIVSQLLSM